MLRSRLLGVVVIVGLAATFAAGAMAVSDQDPINACYSTSSGNLRIAIDPGCRTTETPISWNQAGPSGPPGATGPTSISTGGAEIENFGTGIAVHVVTAQEAGLNLITAVAYLRDLDGSQGGVTQLNCSLMLGSGGVGHFVTLQDTGIADRGDTGSFILLRRDELVEGQVLAIVCSNVHATSSGMSGIAGTGYLMLQRVDS
jgi:hypothetical protein